MIARCLCVLVLVACVACNPAGSPKNHFDDEVLIKIADLQDRRETDSLIALLDKAGYQKAVALAFGSVQDSSAIDDLGAAAFGWGQDTSALSDLTHLSTVDLETRINTAFALGQMNNPKAAAVLSAAKQLDNIDPLLSREVYEAFGKVTLSNVVEPVVDQVQIEELEGGDTAFTLANVHFVDVDEEGVAWGIYRAGLRGITDSSSVRSAAEILAGAQGNFGQGDNARLPAAHFFSRTAFKLQPGVAEALVASASDPNPEIRMAVVNSLSKVKDNEVIKALANATKDADYRVRVSAARALRTQPWAYAKKYYEHLLADSSVHVNVAAAEVIINVATDTTSLLSWARKATNWRAQATLYECFLKLSPTLSGEVKTIYNNSKNPYQQAALITALSQGDNADFVFEQFNNSDIKVIKSTAAAAIVAINYRQPKKSQEFVDIYKKVILDGDQGAIIPVCNALRDSTLGFKKLITDFSFLEEAKSKLSLPRDYETYVPLERTLNYFKSLPPPPALENKYNHPIDWKLAVTIPKDQKVTIETTKGTIVMQLFIEEAPGSVVNFVKLVNDKYFDGKYFHRVVPNFVIQTGCNRGDGFGGEDYSIRSEFSRRKYKTGSVGMASAGKDTEGTQWFITHSPTPHLDGKYTIFAEVVSGMEVVHKIEVGDQIISARLE